ncbi:MAG: YeeE/YedE family protein, partial [Octadecabacter sp.]|nr:YeeE/YedE family protein [Octadecabacter sp.]
FGVAAQITRFCLRRAIAGQAEDRRQAGAVWVVALATAIAGFQIAQSVGWVDLGGHRYLSTDLPYLAIVLGGLAFGAGMILTRGCASRLTVLAASGNLRAVAVLVVFAIVAHATLKGVLSPLRMGLGSLTVDLPFGTLASLPFVTAIAVSVAVLAAFALVLRFKPRGRDVALGAMIGLVPVVGWATTSVLLFDEFDPLEIQTVAFTLPWSDTLFWTLASTAVPAGFGTGLIGGVLLGSFASAALRGELERASFEQPQQVLRYGAGGALMGFGGVLAGGCTVGAGLSGVSTLSIAALLALGSITAGGLLASRLARPAFSGVTA